MNIRWEKGIGSGSECAEFDVTNYLIFKEFLLTLLIIFSAKFNRMSICHPST